MLYFIYNILYKEEKMKKKVFLNLVMGISLIATPALLLASCSAQASDVNYQ